MKKKVKKILKKHLKGTVLIFAIIFLIIGMISGFLVYSLTNKEGFTKIELNGEHRVDLNVGQIYQEAGFTFVIDDKNYNDDVKVEGNLDINKEGTYVLTYTLDKDGHNIILTRIVNVIGGVSDGK